jgi:hypothetical protein
MHTPTFEEIDKHVRAVDLSKFQPRGEHHFISADVRSNPAYVLAKVCAVYHAARPVIAVLSGFWFFPANWKALIKTFTDTMDGLCPGGSL